MHFDNYNLHCVISIHALLAESDFTLPVLFVKTVLFLSTLSLRRATRLGLLGWLRVLISIHALLAESDRRSVKLFHQNYISIHALLAESDPRYLKRDLAQSISIHALLAESDMPDVSVFNLGGQFLSTLSLRRATGPDQQHERHL